MVKLKTKAGVAQRVRRQHTGAFKANSLWAKRRISLSGPPPAANGTMILTGRWGYDSRVRHQNPFFLVFDPSTLTKSST